VRHSAAVGQCIKPGCNACNPTSHLPHEPVASPKLSSQRPEASLPCELLGMPDDRPENHYHGK